MRRVVLLIFSLALVLVSAPSANAVSTLSSDQATTKTEAPFIITNYSSTASRLNFVQLYNKSSDVQSLDGWVLEYTLSDGSTAQTIQLPVVLSGLVAPSKYIIVADTAMNFNSPFEYTTTNPTQDDPFNVSVLKLTPPDNAPYLSHEAQVPSKTSSTMCEDDSLLQATAIRRRISTATGYFLSSFCYYSLSTDTILYMDQLYDYPENVSLQITEIDPNARRCSPSDNLEYCQDYVKFYNPTSHEIDLSGFRLRNGYLGQVSSASNTLRLGGVLLPGHYAVIQMNIANQASWLWLEDTYGLYRYDTTVTAYPTAGTSKEGQAWAYNESIGDWQWTTTPFPYDGASVFPPPPPTLAPKVKEYAPCDSGEYRSKETNRCRKLAVKSALSPCRADQYRSVETNRCRSIVATTSSLKPCSPDQYRSPETNRCRSLKTASANLTPCMANQERNPETNRCRNKTTVMPKADFAIESLHQTSSAFIGWWALGGIGILAVGYGVWEWRSEIVSAIRRVGNFFTSRT